MKNKFLTLFCIIQISVMAQKKDSLFLSINVVPQYVFINGIKADIEYKVSDDINDNPYSNISIMSLMRSCSSNIYDNKLFR